MTKTSYTLKDFTAIGSIARASLVVVVNPQGRFQTMGALLEVARNHPGSVTVGHAGLGTTNNVALLGLERSEEHTSELQSLIRISYAVFCLKKKKQIQLTK